MKLRRDRRAAGDPTFAQSTIPNEAQRISVAEDLLDNANRPITTVIPVE